MPIRKITLGFALLFAGGALAQTGLIRSGTNHAAGTQVPESTARYAVRTGENDWVLARRFHITPEVLRSLNPGVDWDHVQIGQQVKLPSIADDLEAPPKVRTSRASIKGSSVTIRRGPGTDHEAIATVDKGTPVSVMERDGDWYKLEFPKGTVGWVRGDFLQEPSDSAGSFVRRSVARDSVSKAEQILSKAKSFRGVRYRWGGMSRSGTDCSGFTSQVFRSQGYKLPRTSREQSTIGTKVGRDQLRAGDLVFFHTSRGSRITHVGIYAGNGNFIHASSGGGHVQINSLGEGYYRNRFSTARRLLKAPKPTAENLHKYEHLTDPEAGINASPDQK